MNFEGKVDSYIDQLPDFERGIAERIREMIMAAVPGVVEKLSYKIPFYHYLGMFCYMNYLKKGNGLEWVFCRGKDLVDAHPMLITQGRAMVAGVTLQKDQPVKWDLLQQILYDAVAWQEMAYQQKKSFVKRSKKKR